MSELGMDGVERHDSHEPGAATPDDGAPVSVRSLLSAEELQRFRQPNSWLSAYGLALIWGQVLLGLSIYLLVPNAFTFAIAFCLIAAGQHGLSLAGHEFVHYSIVPGNRRLNDRLGSWFFTAPIGLPLTLYRYRHFAHHRLYGTPEDTKTVYRRDARGWRLWWELLLCLCGAEYAYRAFESIARDRGDTSQGRQVPGPAETLPPIAGAQLMIFGFFCLFDPVLYIGLWLIPIVTLSNAINKLRAWMEHRPLDSESGVDPDSGYYHGTPGPFVRTVTANRFERFFISKLNFGYHVEHHIWPQVSYQYLPLVRQRLVEHGVFADGRFGFEETYLSTIHKLWRPTEAPSEGDRARATA